MTEQTAEKAQAAAARALLDYFGNGGPDTPIRTTWPGGVECWEVPADDLRPLLLAVETAQMNDAEVEAWDDPWEADRG